ncbi:cellulose synthase-like protein G2 isoform X2 [Brassica napus]|uniref:cellulose synthase-like protein G2 isoform X2 n=1 Tax=Brassica napus TaxID=3708 RepID=UPI002078615D|nr:cellulose synthase-like protein G2 isoform X2 [Brassica napus]
MISRKPFLFTTKMELQTTQHSTKLHMCHPCRRTIPYRIYAVVHMCGIIALMYHHAHSLFTEHTALLTSLLLISDVVLASMWASTTSLRLNPVHRTEYPEKYVAKPEEHFPKLDVFICTADPYKEPPMMVANTVLSVMAYGYPSDKISVYVSDDGGSSLTLFALMEAAKFSEHWLPFCKKNNVQDRSPEVYFSLKSSSWTEEAENLKVLQNNETEITPNLIYVSREKIRATPHHFKAGALNTLLRVSSVMTNSPIILTLDCDMYSNNPTTPLHALCYLSDPKINFGLGFVQFPQRFQGINRNDVYASELRRPFDINMVGYDGLMGPIHVGTGCFFNRRIFYGPPANLILPELDELAPTRIADKPIKAHTVLALAHNVAGCNYEHNTNWGSKIGFRYGSLVEDYYTGFMLHCEGWRSMFCRPQRAAFYGSTPKRLTDVVWQQMRWSIGLLEMGFSRYSPFTYGLKSLGLFTGLGYCYYVVWPFCSIPITVYGVLPQLALIYGIRVFPKPSDQWFWLYIFLSLGAYAQDLSDFLLEGGTCRKWWNDQRMWLIRGLSSFFFGMIEYTLKTLNLSTPGFDFAPSSSIFLPMTAVAVLNLFAFVSGLYGLFAWGEGLSLELMLASFVVVNSLPIYEAMVLRKDDGKLQKGICFLAGILTLVLILGGYFLLK